MSFSNDDLKKHAALKTILERGTYPLEGRAVAPTAFLFSWFNDLEGKIRESIGGPKPSSKPLKPKEVKQPIKQIGK